LLASIASGKVTIVATALEAEVVQHVGSADLRKRLIDAVDAIESEETVPLIAAVLVVYAEASDALEQYLSPGASPEAVDAARRMVDRLRARTAQLFPAAPPAVSAPAPVAMRGLQDWVRLCIALTTEVPIDQVVARAVALNAPGIAHDARTAYDRLRAFIRRNDPARAKQWETADVLYRSGLLSLDQIADLVGMSPSDTIFELEQDGHVRSPEVIALLQGERAEIYERLRQRRLARSGSRVPDPELVDRDVIASERIEGVDARAWMRRR
jgi:predicted DNA-binding transcriptional regulator AlpA